MNPQQRKSLLLARGLILLIGLGMLGIFPFYAHKVCDAFGLAPRGEPVPLEAYGITLTLMLATAVAGVVTHLVLKWYEHGSSWLRRASAALFAPVPLVLWLVVALIYARSITPSYFGFVVGLFVSLTETGAVFVATTLWLEEVDREPGTPARPKRTRAPRRPPTPAPPSG